MKTISKTSDEIRETVRERYGRIVETGASCCGTSGCCGAAPSAVEDIARVIGYSDEDLAAIPEGANLGLGCGNPLQHADVKAGETVLDLGSGAGMDVFVAAEKVGPTGLAIGVDMTPEMLLRAKSNAAQVGIHNVEFRLGEIEHLPVADNSVDLIISNCVINLSPDKSQVFAEARRVLKPGGRMVVSDLVLKHQISERLHNDIGAYIGCVSGASLKDEYLRLIREAGFERVDVVEDVSYEIGLDTVEDDLRREAFEAVSSVKVRAYKPR